MSDFDPTKKLAGVPLYLWIVGGVAVSYGFVKWRQSRQPAQTETVNPDAVTPLATGSGGGTGLQSDSPYGAPAAIGITAPTPTNPLPVYVVPNPNPPKTPTTPPKTPTTVVKTPVPKVTTKPATTVTKTQSKVTTTHPQATHKRGYTNAQLEAAKKRKAKGTEA